MFKFNTKANRYINDKGQFVSEKFVLENLDAHRLTIRQKLNDILNNYESTNQASLENVLPVIANEIRHTHIVNYIVGKGGINNIKPEDIDTLNKELTKELVLAWGENGNSYGLEEVFNQHENGLITYPQLKARVLSYLKGTRKTYYLSRSSLNQLGYAQRFLNGTDNCDDCIRYAALGIVRKESLPLPGYSCVCGHNCNCTLEYKSEKQYLTYINKNMGNEES